MAPLLLLVLGCPRPAVDPLFPIPGITAETRPKKAKRPSKAQRERDACVAACLERDMARAVAWQQVVTECQAECTPPTPLR